MNGQQPRRTVRPRPTAAGSRSPTSSGMSHGASSRARGTSRRSQERVSVFWSSRSVFVVASNASNDSVDILEQHFADKRLVGHRRARHWAFVSGGSQICPRRSAT